MQGDAGDDAALSPLLATKALRGLDFLHLGSNGIGDEGGVALAGAKWKVKRLDIHSNAIGEAGALALAASPALAGIENKAASASASGS